jgi:peptidoglycan/LPS O-acetylase OafA/YrhL
VARRELKPPAGNTDTTDTTGHDQTPTLTMDHQATSRIVGADTIRALATLWVFAGHLFVLEPALKSAASPVSRVLAAGYMGVSAFFVLSGFLLSMPLWRAYQAGGEMPNLGLYLRRRLTRIAPEFYVCVLILAALTGALSSKWGLMQVVSCLTFTNTLLPPMYMPAFNAPLWSIGIEMSFYLMLPVAMFGMFRLRGRFGAPAYLAALLGLIVLSQPLLIWAAPTLEKAIGNESLFSATSSSTLKNAGVLFAHFLIGVIVAGLYQRRPPRPTAGRINRYDLAVLLGAGVVGGSLIVGYTLPGLGYMHYQWPTFPAIVGLLLFSLPRSAAIGRWLDGPFIRGTATLSYGLYIWHVPILTGLKNFWPKTGDGRIMLFPLFVVSALACVYLVAAASYYLVGKPALDGMRARETKRKVCKTLPVTATPTRDHRAA